MPWDFLCWLYVHGGRSGFYKIGSQGKVCGIYICISRDNLAYDMFIVCQILRENCDIL